jgi:hypothetical protein
MCEDEDVDVIEEIPHDDGIGVDIYYSCYTCGCEWVEHSYLEILNEGTGVRITN